MEPVEKTFWMGGASERWIVPHGGFSPVTKGRNEPRSETPSTVAAWEKLTWNDLDDWAGSRSVSRGKSYQRQGRVKQLCLSEAGVLLAWVEGGERYATRVELDAAKRRRADRIRSKCSCPVGLACKHAVAVIVEYLKAIEGRADVPAVPDAEPRWAVIEGGGYDFYDDDDDEGDWLDDDRRDDEVPQEAAKSGTPAQQTRASTVRKDRKISDTDTRSHLESKSHKDLVSLVMQISDRDPHVRRALADESALAGGQFDLLLREARSEMRSLTAEDAWWDSWKGEGHLPDFSGLEERLKTLLAHGYADVLVELGEELVQRGVEQIGRSHDDGETSLQISKCMRVIDEALLKSNRSDEDKIIYAIDVSLADDYGICDDFGSVLDRRWKKAIWSAVADRLRERLERQPKASRDVHDLSGFHARKQLTGWMMDALDKAARSDEATQLCVAEARDSGSYTRAVRRLLDEKAFDRAADLAEEGLRETSPTNAGIISELQDLLCEIATRNEDWILPAAVAAARFFDRPSVASYRGLLKAAKRAKCEQDVQSGALSFLETGRHPERAGKSQSKRKPGSPWPLPEPPQPRPIEPRGRFGHLRDGPRFDVLIDLAIEEKRLDDVLRWFDKKEAANKSASRPFPARISRGDARIAEAVESLHPDRAMVIYQQLADSIASETNPKTYPEAGSYLKRIKRLLKKAGRGCEWPTIVDEFRSNHGRKPRLMEVIDGIDSRPIVNRSRK